MTAGDLVYRFWRQRRLLILYAALILCGAVIGGMTQPVIVLALGLGLFVIAVQVIWPASWLDCTAMAFATAVMLALAPVLVRVSGMALPGRETGMTVALGLLAVVAWLLLVMLAMAFLVWLNTMRVGERSFRAVTHLSLSPSEAADAFVVRPGKRMHNRICGPADNDGLFEISFVVELADEVTLAPAQERLSFRARVLEFEENGDRIRSLVQSFPPSGGSSVAEQVFEREGNGTRYEYREVHDVFTVLNVVFYWLQDAYADHLRAELDGYLGRRTPALAFGSHVGFLVRIAGAYRNPGDI